MVQWNISIIIGVSAWELAKISDRRPLNCTQIEHTKVNCIYFKVGKVLIGKSIPQYEAI